MHNSISNSSNSLWRFLWISPLLISIIALQLLIILKHLLINVYNLLKWLIIKFMEEMDFYLTKMRSVSSKLLNFLKTINSKLTEVRLKAIFIHLYELII